MIDQPPLTGRANQPLPSQWTLDVTEETPFYVVKEFILESFQMRQSMNTVVDTEEEVRSESFIVGVPGNEFDKDVGLVDQQLIACDHQTPVSNEVDSTSQRELVLVVEDHLPTQRLERLILQSAGHLVKATSRGEDALEILKETMPSLILLDVGLAGEDGFTTCRRIREVSQVPIIMVTGRDSNEDRVTALDCGADDFLTKAFLGRDLAARVRTLLDLGESRNRLANRELQIDEGPDLEELYEGEIPLAVQVRGSMRRLIEFTGELRDRLDMRVLRFEAHESKVNLLLGLRLPLALKRVLLEMASVEGLGPDISLEGQDSIQVNLLP